MSILFRCLAALSALLALQACSRPEPLSVADVARFRSELIAPRPECQTFIQQLDPARVKSFAEADQIYHAAKAVSCIKPDV
jgi:hypothetical protein